MIRFFATLFLIYTSSAVGQISQTDSTTAIKITFEPTSYEFIPDVKYVEMDSVLKTLANEVPLEFNDRVKSFIDYFTVRDREYTSMVAARVPDYFPLFEKYLAEYEMPDELKYLSVIESGLNPRAISRAGAVGLWQFMSATGRAYGLNHDFYIDDRMDPVKSTEAACKYLKWLHGMFDNWELAIAAYNCGPGNVRKAIRRSGYKQTFWEIYRYLPRETRGYLPQYVAIIYTLNNLDRHLITPDPADNAPVLDTILVDDFVNLNSLASHFDVCHEDLLAYNPSLVHGAVPAGKKNFPVMVPYDVKPRWEAHRDSLLEHSRYGQEQLEYMARNMPGSTWGRKKVYYTVRSGDVLGLIAQRYQVRVVDIKAWNNLNSHIIRVGQRLSIWVPDGSSLTGYPVKSEPKVEKVNGEILYTVRPGDTLWEICKRYNGLTIEKLRDLNKLNTDRIYPGQKLKIG